MEFGKVFRHGIHLLSTQKAATHTIHRVLRDACNVLHADQAVVVLKNPKTDYLEIKYSCDISHEIAKVFRRDVGKNLIARVFYKDEFAEVQKSGNPADYAEMKMEEDFEKALVARIPVCNHTIGFVAYYFRNEMVSNPSIECFLITLGEFFGEAIEKERFLNCLSKLKRYDFHTGLFCQEYFLHRFHYEARRSERYKVPLSLALLDIDNYKEIMNLYGEDTANRMYREISEDLRSCLRGVDIVGIFGTDEFIVFMPQTSMENAECVFRRFQDMVQNKEYTEKRVHTSLGIGISCLEPGSPCEEVIWKSQTALYEARLHGRGKICLFPLTQE